MYLSSADLLLGNGVQSYPGGSDATAARGLSFHSDGSDLTNGWAYNPTGAAYASMSAGQRVFLTCTETQVPEPGVLLLPALGASGFAAARRRALRRPGVGAATITACPKRPPFSPVP